MRVAYVSLIPDAGHLIPLIRIASAFEKRHQCKFFVVEEAFEIMKLSGFEFMLLPPALPVNASLLLSKISTTSPFKRKIFFNRYFETHYYQPIQKNGFKILPLLKKELSSFRPDIIITDEHLLGLAVHVTGHHLGINVLQHRSSGSNQQCQDRQPYAKSSSFFTQPLINATSKVVGKIYNTLSRTRNSAKFIESQSIKSEVEKNWMRIIKEKQTQNKDEKIFTTGMAVLESKYLKDKINICKNITIFGPTPPLLDQRLSNEDEHWLSLAPEKPVILMSLGSMVSISEKLAKALIWAIKKNDGRLLWVSKRNTIPSDYHNDPDVRQVSWAPQPALLSDTRVQCFVTHAGSGAIQEAFWFGKTMLCIPQIWDQPYNAWVVEALGVGKKIDKKHFSSAGIANALHLTLHDPSMKMRIRHLSQEIRKLNTKSQLNRYIEENAILADST